VSTPPIDPRCTHRVLPVYPGAALQQGTQGVVVLELQVGTDGIPINSKLHRNSAANEPFGELLEAAGHAAAMKFRCDPASKPYVMRQEIRFTLAGTQSRHCPTRVAPRYPVAALQQGISARLVVRIKLSPQGIPLDAEVVSNSAAASVHALQFEAAAKAAAVRYRCAPAAGAYEVEQPITFSAIN
jgi:TonB family protein